MSLTLAVPLGQEFLQELFHDFVTVLRQLSAGFSKHTILQQKQLLVEVIDGGAVAIFVGFKCVVLLGGDIWIVHRTPFGSAIGKGATNTNRSNGVKFISIMDDLSFNGLELCLYMSALEGNITNNIFDMLNDSIVYVQACEPFSRCTRSGFFVVMELPVGDIMQKSSQLHRENVHAFFRFGYVLSKFPDTIHMPVVMAGTFGRKFFFNKGSCLFDHFRFGHAYSLAERTSEVLHNKIQRQVVVGFQNETHAPKSGTFLPLLFILAGYVAARWNTFYPNLIGLYEKLVELGFSYIDGEVYVEGLELGDLDNV